MGRWVFDKPVCENVAIEDCGLLALFVEIEEEVVRIVWVSVCGIHGWGTAAGGTREREGGGTETGEWREDGSN